MVYSLPALIVLVAFIIFTIWYFYTRLLFVEIPGKIVQTSPRKQLQLPKYYREYSMQSVTASYVFNCLPYNTTGTVYLKSGTYKAGDKISLYVNSRNPRMAFVDYSYLSIWKRCHYAILQVLHKSTRLFRFVSSVVAGASSMKSRLLGSCRNSRRKKTSKKEVKRKSDQLKNRAYHRTEFPKIRNSIKSNASMDRAYFIASLAKSCLILCFVIASASLLSNIIKDTLYRINYTVFPAEIISIESEGSMQKICVSLSLGDELHLTADSFGDQYTAGDTVYVAVNRHSHDVVLSKKSISFNRVTFAFSTFLTLFTVVVSIILFICSIRSILVFWKVTKIKTRIHF